MKKAFSKTWKSSTQPRKQRKYRHNAPLHIKSKFVSVHLSKDLREKHGIRSIPIKKGDKVKVLRGQFKKKEGKVEEVSLKKSKVYVTKIESVKKDGSKILSALEPSNLMIIELDLNDKKRLKQIERKGNEPKQQKKQGKKPEESQKLEDKKNG